METYSDSSVLKPVWDFCVAFLTEHSTVEVCLVSLAELMAPHFDCEIKAAYTADNGRIYPIFTLPVLFQLLFSQETQLSYPKFRQALFASDLNQRLREQGLEVVIHEHGGKVDSHLYALRPLPG